MGPWLWAAGPTPAWWAFSFGAAALPTAALKLLARGDTGAVGVLAPWLFALGNLAIAAFVIMTISLLIRGRLLPVPITAPPPIADVSIRERRYVEQRSLMRTTAVDELPSATHYRTVTVDGLDIFYREAGPADAPTILLLRGPQCRSSEALGG